MFILPDVNELFVPFVNGFFVDYETAKANLKRFILKILNHVSFNFRCLDDIRATFSNTCITETILGPAINVGLKALIEANRNGKIFVFHTNLPRFEAPGCLKNREDRKLLGTDKEKVILILQAKSTFFRLF